MVGSEKCNRQEMEKSFEYWDHVTSLISIYIIQYVLKIYL